jgi:hypothetical protein
MTGAQRPNFATAFFVAGGADAETAAGGRGYNKLNSPARRACVIFAQGCKVDRPLRGRCLMIGAQRP